MSFFVRSVSRTGWRSHLKTMTLLLIALILTLSIKAPTVNAASEESTLNAEVYQFEVGDFKVATISDGLLAVPPLPTYAPTADPEEVERAMVERFWSPDNLILHWDVFAHGAIAMNGKLLSGSLLRRMYKAL